MLLPPRGGIGGAGFGLYGGGGGGGDCESAVLLRLFPLLLKSEDRLLCGFSVYCTPSEPFRGPIDGGEGCEGGEYPPLLLLP